MAIPGFDEERTEEIMESIRDRAAAYVGNWSFNPEFPDMGTTLALLFADMMGDTVKRFACLPERYRIRFYQLLGADLLPPKEAEGYVTFSNVNEEVAGVMVNAGEKILGNGRENTSVFLETTEEVYVSSARLDAVYFVDGKEDYISNPLDFPIVEERKDNQQSHICYFGHSTVFDVKSEGEIRIDFPLLQHRYETETERLLKNESTWFYYSEEGFTAFSDIRYEEGTVYLYKDKKMPAFQCKDIQGTESFWLKLATGGMKAGSRVNLPGIFLASVGSYILPEVVYDGMMELDREDFLPFGEQPYPYAEVYISCDEVLSKKGAVIGLDFDLEMRRIPGERKSPEFPVLWKNVMHQSAFKQPEPVDILVDAVVFEYYNGFGWTRIPDTKRYETVFRSGQDEEHMVVNFLCPRDICPFLTAARESYCIRLRISKMVNRYAMDGIYVVPRIKKLTLGYRYEGGRILPEQSYAVNHLVMEKLGCGGEFTPFYQMFPDRKMLYLSFSRPLKEEGIRLLFILENPGNNADVRYRYECYGKAGWSGMKVEDETMHFHRTGLVTLYAAHDFEKTEFFGHAGYWIRIVQEAEEVCLPVISGIYINSTRALTIKGKGESLPPGAVYGMEKNIGFISKVTNHESITGGFCEENKEQAVKRFSAFLRHQGRAVTDKDFEDLVCCGVRNTAQVKCFSGRNEKGERMPGHITLAVLPEMGKDIYAGQIREQVIQSLLPYIDRGLYEEGRLHIVEPEWVPISIYMTIMVRDHTRIYQLREKVCQKINAFIHPVTGNFDGKGWKIGTLPSASQLKNACSQMEEILYIRNLSVREENRFGLYALGIGGEHEIEVIQE